MAWALCRWATARAGADAPKYTNIGRLMVSISDLLGVRWLDTAAQGPGRNGGDYKK